MGMRFVLCREIIGMLDSLDRFISAQQNDYETALAEIRSGRKRSHWMWYIFPQLRGLGLSATSQYYALRDLHEAEAYLHHPVLGKRLEEISEALLQLPTDDALAIFGSPDDLKLCSCMTLFAQVPHAPAVFKKVLDKYCRGKYDERTMELLR